MWVLYILFGALPLSCLPALCWPSLPVILSAIWNLYVKLCNQGRTADVFHIGPLNSAALHRRQATGDIYITCVFLHVKVGGEEGDEEKGTESDCEILTDWGGEIAASWEVAWRAKSTQWMRWWSWQGASIVQPRFNRQPFSFTPRYSQLWLKIRPAFPCCSCFRLLANVDKLLYTCSWNVPF